MMFPTMRSLMMLAEGMRSLDGLAVIITDAQDGLNGLVVIYDPANVSLKINTKAILAVAIYHHYRDGLWIVGSVMAVNGYGPMVYTIVADLAFKSGASLIPSDLRSDASKKLWLKFGSNPYVTITKLADKQGNGRSYNTSPTGFSIVGNGTLDISQEIAADHDMKNKLGDAWHESLIEEARSKLKSAMNRI